MTDFNVVEIDSAKNYVKTLAEDVNKASDIIKVFTANAEECAGYMGHNLDELLVVLGSIQPLMDRGQESATEAVNVFNNHINKLDEAQGINITL